MGVLAGLVSFTGEDMGTGRARRPTLAGAPGTQTWTDHGALIAASGCRRHTSFCGSLTAGPGHTVAVAISGEIDNLADLKTALERRGHAANAYCVNELVLHSYLEWSDQLDERLNGMFAAVVWDGRDKRVVMIRDHLGLEPLYYSYSADGVAFGSTAELVLRTGMATPVVDADGLRELCVFTTSPGRTPWRDVDEVEPGTTVAVSRSGTRRRRHWSMPVREHTDDRITTVERIREHLCRVVDHQVVDHRPACLLLSGGLDSSALAGFAAARAASPRDVYTFAVIPAESTSTSDLAYVNDVVETNGSIHRNLTFTAATLACPDVRRAVVAARGTPKSWGDADASLLLAFRTTSETSNTVVSGDLADALFGFHPGTLPSLLCYRAFPGEPRPWVTGWNEALRPELVATLDVSNFTEQRYADAISAMDHLPGASAFDRRMREIATLGLQWTARTVLVRRALIANAAGVNARVPFGDRKLVEYAFNIPWSLKTFDHREKSVLRSAAAAVVPDSVLARPKSGYPSTRNDAYVAEIQTQAKDLLSERHHDLFSLVSWDWLRRAAHDQDTASRRRIRFGLDRCLDLYHWLNVYRPHLAVPQ